MPSTSAACEVTLIRTPMNVGKRGQMRPTMRPPGLRCLAATFACDEVRCQQHGAAAATGCHTVPTWPSREAALWYFPRHHGGNLRGRLPLAFDALAEHKRRRETEQVINLPLSSVNGITWSAV